MKTGKIMLVRKLIVSVSLLGILLPASGFSKKKDVAPLPVMDSIQAARFMDSIHRLYLNEVNFIIDHIENTYISGRRGMSDEEWNQRVEIARSKAVQSNNKWEYLYNWCYLGALIQDQHFDFPDKGMYNRYRIFLESDSILPLWVQTWKDGTVYNVKDYTGMIPAHAQILSVNGLDAQKTALEKRMMSPGEEAYAMAWMNASEEPDPRGWNAFANFFWMRGHRPPFKVVYKAQGSDRPDTVVLNGMARGDIYKEFQKSDDKYRVRSSRGARLRPIEYRNMQDSIGVLTINMMWGKRWTPMLLFGKDQRYPRMLRRAMRSIDRDGTGLLHGPSGRPDKYLPGDGQQPQNRTGPHFKRSSYTQGRPSPAVGFSRRYEVRDTLSYGYSFLYAVPATTSETQLSRKCVYSDGASNLLSRTSIGAVFPTSRHRSGSRSTLRRLHGGYIR